ncbi:MAG: hypothetical protein KDA61_11975 [Planctomycetales bacterium]|nr:hypothetical protein [Planctomycetales bacterium]
MSNLPPTASIRDVLNMMIRRRKVWLRATIACGILAMIVAFLTPRQWQASQALVVRQEAAASRTSQPGKFSDLYEMRTLQETILEIARSRQVVANTLAAVASLDDPSAAAPSESDVEEFRSGLDMLPPGGAEFGKTEVFYFAVKNRSRSKAVALVAELCTQLEKRMQELLSEKAGGLVLEVQKQVEAAEVVLAQQTQRLTEFEAKIGPDLGELRMLHSALSGQSEVRQLVINLEEEMRRYETQANDGQRLLETLEAALDDPDLLVAMPNSLLVTQPAIQQLKAGLVRAQLHTARMRGTRADQHPRVVAAVEAEDRIRRDLHLELTSAIESARAEKKLAEQRFAAAKVRRDDVDKRLNRLAESRVEYSNRVAAVDTARAAVDAARGQLAAAAASQAAAASASLVTRLDRPEVGSHPTGPGRTTITAAGLCAGFLLGAAICFLRYAPIDLPHLSASDSYAGREEPSADWATAISQSAAPVRQTHRTVPFVPDAFDHKRDEPLVETAATPAEPPSAKPELEPEWYQGVARAETPAISSDVSEAGDEKLGENAPAESETSPTLESEDVTPPASESQTIASTQVFDDAMSASLARRGAQAMQQGMFESVPSWMIPDLPRTAAESDVDEPAAGSEIASVTSDEPGSEQLTVSQHETATSALSEDAGEAQSASAPEATVQAFENDYASIWNVDSEVVRDEVKDETALPAEASDGEREPNAKASDPPATDAATATPHDMWAASPSSASESSERTSESDVSTPEEDVWGNASDPQAGESGSDAAGNHAADDAAGTSASERAVTAEIPVDEPPSTESLEETEDASVRGTIPLADAPSASGVRNLPQRSLQSLWGNLTSIDDDGPATLPSKATVSDFAGLTLDQAIELAAQASE